MPQQPTQANPPPTTNACPFVAGPMIRDPRLFVGRKEVLRTITSRMTGPQPTSINVIGERRMGKSSLLYHFFQTWEQRVVDPSERRRYVVIYLSLEAANCGNENDFYQAVAQKLLARPAAQKKALADPLKKKRLDRQAFSSAIEKWKNADVLPVLCLDEFEGLLEKPDKFVKGFYDNLRNLMNQSALMFIISSKDKLKPLAEKKGLTSAFFNVGQTHSLGELTEEEATDLVRLPASTVAGATAVLSLDEQKQAREWGGCHPQLLHLAGLCLYEARQQGKDVAWAKHRFDEQASNVPRPWSTVKKLLLWLRLLFVEPFVRLGRVPFRAGKALSTIIEFCVGVGIVVIVILILLGLVSETPFWNIVLEYIPGLP